MRITRRQLRRLILKEVSNLSENVKHGIDLSKMSDDKDEIKMVKDPKDKNYHYAINKATNQVYIVKSPKNKSVSLTKATELKSGAPGYRDIRKILDNEKGVTFDAIRLKDKHSVPDAGDAVDSTGN